ncbi:MAG TPA: peptidase M61, partial [Rhodocyclaceae bacterium]|nr:peptidase M61 [Rhodocyclaceae bacterium]
MKDSAVHYTVEIASAEAHLFRVTLTIHSPSANGETLRLPLWIPGSYMVREFSKNIVRLTAEQGGKSAALTKQNKFTWHVSGSASTSDAPLVVVADIYAWDLSVRCAHLDQTHGFFNGTQLFLSVEGREDSPHFVELRKPRGAAYDDWQVATTLKTVRKKSGSGSTTKEANSGFELYRAESYDELVDHPVEMGKFTLLKFSAGGVPHQMAITGASRFDAERLTQDLEKICTWHIDLFGSPPPFERYLFLVTAVGEGYGGLEHRDSTSLLCSRNDLPAPGMKTMEERYRTFLGLCSHEYFHAWNVKRIQPAAFKPYRLYEENYTKLLWMFEGFTSYYDDLALVRTGIISHPDYLGMLAKTITNVERASGRLKQSVAESSFDAWIKFYRQDENSPNAVVSYYAKGSLIAFGLDLTIRVASEGKRSLDDVMRYLWLHYGQTGRGVEDDEMPSIIKAATDVDVHREIAEWVEGTVDVPLEKLFKSLGGTLTRKPGGVLSGLGIKTKV